MTIQGVARRFEYLEYNIVISQKVVVILKRNARTRMVTHCGRTLILLQKLEGLRIP